MNPLRNSSAGIFAKCALAASLAIISLGSIAEAQAATPNVRAISPAGGIYDRTPSLQWKRNGAKQMRVKLVDENKKVRLERRISAREANCGSDNTCSIVTPSLGTGKFKWWVRSIDNGKKGADSVLHFHISGSSSNSKNSLPAVRAISPKGSIFDRTPTLQWKRNGASSMHVEVFDANNKKRVDKRLTAKAAGCESNGICSVTAPSLQLGAFEWRVRSIAGEKTGKESKLGFKVVQKQTADTKDHTSTAMPTNLGDGKKWNAMCLPPANPAKEIKISATEIQKRTKGSSGCGKTFVINSGNHKGFTIGASCSVDNPVIVQAQKPLSAKVRGNIVVKGKGIVVRGFHVLGGQISVDGSRNRLTRNKVENSSRHAVVLEGDSSYNRIDHNEILGMTSASALKLDRVQKNMKYNLFDSNYVHSSKFKSGCSQKNRSSDKCNGADGIQLGEGSTNHFHHFTLITRNYIEKVSSDSEAISLKSSSNYIEYNTIRHNGNTSIGVRMGSKNQYKGNRIRATRVLVAGDDTVFSENYVEDNSTVGLMKGEAFAPDANKYKKAIGKYPHVTTRRGVVSCNKGLGKLKIVDYANKKIWEKAKPQAKFQKYNLSCQDEWQHAPSTPSIIGLNAPDAFCSIKLASK